jgi:hypothetical protein
MTPATASAIQRLLDTLAGHPGLEVTEVPWSDWDRAEVFLVYSLGSFGDSSRKPPAGYKISAPQD